MVLPSPGGAKFLSQFRVLPPRFNRSKNEVVYAECPPEIEPQYNFHVAVDIAFGEVDIIGSHPVLRVLKAMVSIVEGILAAIEAETRRLFPSAFS